MNSTWRSQQASKRTFRDFRELKPGESCVKIKLISKHRSPGTSGFPTMVVEVEGIGVVEARRQGDLRFWMFNLRKTKPLKWVNHFDREMDRLWSQK